MRCPKCGTENKENFCMKCGTMLSNDGIIQIKDTRVNNDSLHSDLEFFIGKNYEKILNGRLNFAAAFFFILWFIYRKCYLLAFILFLIQLFIVMLVSVFFEGINIYFIYIIFILFYLFFANTLYILDARRKIKKIKKKNVSYLAAIKKKGGTSIVAVIIFPIIYIVAIIALIIFLLPYLRNIYKAYDLYYYMPNWNYDKATSTFIKDNNCYAQIGELNEQGEILLYNYYGVKEDFSNLKMEKIFGKTWYTNDNEHRLTHNTQLYLFKDKDRIYIAKFFALDSSSYNTCIKNYDTAKKTLFII